MFGLAKKVEKVRLALCEALKRKAVSLSSQGKHDRALVMLDLAEVLSSLIVDTSEDDHAKE